MADTEQSDDLPTQGITIQCPYCEQDILFVANRGVDRYKHGCKGNQYVTITATIVVKKEEA